MTTNGTNRVERKTLASQLDRLDGILDALSDGLNQAVATTVEQAVAGVVGRAVEQAVRQAVGQAVHEAVQAVLTEVLTNPGLQSALAEGGPAPQGQDPLFSGEKAPGRFRRAWGAAGAGLRRLAQTCTKGLKQAGRLSPLAAAAWGLARRCRHRLLLLGGVGVAACLALHSSGPWLAAAAGWVGGLATTLAVQARRRCQHVLQAAPALE